MLKGAGIPFRKCQVAYQISFADSLENRLRILRFLFAHDLTDRLSVLLSQHFDELSRGGMVEISTVHELYMIGEHPLTAGKMS